MIKDEEIINILQIPNSYANKELVIKAFCFAAKVHAEQKRISGEPYINHLIETAKILLDLGLGPITVSAGLLHDVIEDANISKEQIEKEFGKDIAFLVEGVTNLGKIHYRGVERYVESLRKLFVAMSRDLRVLIIKLADRTHNMRTLKYLSEEKQKRIALETLEIYAPLAYRLGIRKLNRELEDLAFPYIHKEEAKKVRELLKNKSRETMKHLEKLRKSVVKGLTKSGITNIKTDYRIKGIFSLYQKLVRKEWDIERIYDILALRIIVPNIEDCYRVLGIVHSVWRPLPGRIKDYIAFPKPNGYRSLHTTIFTGDGSIMEIQIRTEEMHREAEYGIAAHFDYKENIDKKNQITGSGLTWIMQFLPLFKNFKINGDIQIQKDSDIPNWIRQLAEVESKNNEHDQFIKEIKADFFKTRVFVFTPKGDVVDLPSDATTVDFAYAIHSEIGDHMTGAKVNRKMVSMDTILRNGDIVEIETKENAKPSHRMLDLAKTTLAKKHIKNALDKQQNQN